LSGEKVEEKRTSAKNTEWKGRRFSYYVKQALWAIDGCGDLAKLSGNGLDVICVITP